MLVQQIGRRQFKSARLHLLEGEGQKKNLLAFLFSPIQIMSLPIETMRNIPTSLLENIVAMVASETRTTLRLSSFQAWLPRDSQCIVCENEKGKFYVIVGYFFNGISNAYIVRSLLRKRRHDCRMTWLPNGQGSKNALEIGRWREGGLNYFPTDQELNEFYSNLNGLTWEEINYRLHGLYWRTKLETERNYWRMQ